MNSAKRIESLLKIIEKSHNKTAIDIFENAFGVRGCFKVGNKLNIVREQINNLEEKSHPSLISFLREVFSDITIHRNMDSVKQRINPHLVTLHTVGNFMPEETIDKKLITEISDLLVIMQKKIEDSELEDYHKEILYSYCDVLAEGIKDIDEGGVEAFTKAMEHANGKIATYPKVFKSPEIIDTTKEIYEKGTKLVSDAKTWVDVIEFLNNKLLN